MPITLRDKTAETRRRHVLDAAIKVFGEKGFRGASIRDVAKEAGVADGTIYNIFENKFDILVAILDPLSDRTSDLSPASAAGPLDAEAILVRRLDTFTDETLAMMRVLLSEALIDPEIRTQFLDTIIRPMLGGKGHGASGRSATLSHALTASMLGLIVLRLLGEGTPTKERAVVALLTGKLMPAAPGGSSK